MKKRECVKQGETWGSGGRCKEDWGVDKVKLYCILHRSKALSPASPSAFF